MSPEMLQIFAFAFTVWGILVAIKAANALKKNEDYVFGMWDGGMLRAGKRLTRLGAQIKLAVGVLMAVGCVLLLSHAVPLTTASYGIMFIAILSLISDFVTAQ